LAGYERSRVLPDDKPQLGPWLRRYAREEETSPRERAKEYLVAGSVAVGMLVVLVLVLVAFVRFPVPTLGVLVVVWGVGYALYRANKGRAELRERELRARLDRDQKGH
jgi:hypothetical protein